jgi:CHAT domain-containing protein
MYGYKADRTRYGKKVDSIQGVIESCKRLYKQLMEDFISDKAVKPEKIPHLYICPDGEIAQLSFESFMADDETFLVENYTMSYCNSVRDINSEKLRQTRHNALIFADPEYDLTDESIISDEEPFNAVRKYRKLKNAVSEAMEIQNILQNNSIGEFNTYYGKAVSKSRVKAINSPSILHIITHGYFISESFSELLHPLSKSGIVLS